MQSPKNAMLSFRPVLLLERVLYTRYLDACALEALFGFNAYVGSSAKTVGRGSQRNRYLCIPNQGELRKENLYYFGQLSCPRLWRKTKGQH